MTKNLKNFVTKPLNLAFLWKVLIPFMLLFFAKQGFINGYFAIAQYDKFGLCLKIMDIFTQILKHKFKFFTQNSRLFTNSNHLINSRHFINSTHFITLSQILSPTQGFFIFLPQVFAQFLLINSLQRSSYGRQDTKAPF